MRFGVQHCQHINVFRDILVLLVCLFAVEQRLPDGSDVLQGGRHRGPTQASTPPLLLRSPVCQVRLPAHSRCLHTCFRDAPSPVMLHRCSFKDVRVDRYTS